MQNIFHKSLPLLLDNWAPGKISFKKYDGTFPKNILRLRAVNNFGKKL